MRRRWASLLALIALAGVLAAGPAEAHHNPNHGGGKGGGSEPAPDPDPEPDDPAGNGQDPILFVHGWNSSGSVWGTMIDRFKADGWTDAQLFNWSYNHRQSNKTTAQEVLAKIADIKAQTGASHVDVITHSMGGLSTRWCVKFTGCDGHVDGWVSLGGPNHGTRTANFCFDTSCREMRIGSDFLTELNAGDETPGTTTRWATWWSSCDTVIDPSESTILDGAANTRTACLSHSALYEDATVYGQVRDFVSN
jgi:triacylglycerol lipase